MFFVEINESKNILRLTFELDVNEEEAKQCFEKVKDLLPQLEIGFQILTDLRNLKTMDPAAAKYIERMMDTCNKKEPSKVIRVIPDSEKDIGFNIMSIFHYDDSISIITCLTMVEALNRLFSTQEEIEE